MARRKTIAVIAADVFNDYMNNIFVGISDQCRALGYDTCVFVMAFNMDNGSHIQNGEENIFSLINKKSVDGVILLAGNLASQRLIDRCRERFSSFGVPMISADFDYDFAESIYPDDAPMIEMMTDHLIEQHGCKKIICLTGYEGRPARSRLEGYKRSMEKHGLEIREGDIIFGDFWKMASLKLAREIISGEREKPDAVVCANDLMAMHLCNALISGGIRVPEDIRITGYDGSREALFNMPSITTIYPENSLLGARAVCQLHKLITGEDAEPLQMGGGSLILAQSCGCSEGISYIVRNREMYQSTVEKYERYYNKSAMLEGLMEAEKLDGLLHKLSKYLHLINGLDAFMLCLCRNWDNVEEQDDEEYIREGYSAMMDVKMLCTSEGSNYISLEYSPDTIIPEILHDHFHEPKACFLMPVHFMDRCFGYAVFSFSDIQLSISMVFAQWSRNINTALEFLRVRTKLMSMNRRISMSSIRDTLTGVYNRKGFARFSEGLFKRAKKERRKLLIIMADLDLLKHINDNFGHIEGDNAITIAANALNTCCKLGEVCARIGGDEYAIVGIGEYTDEMIDGYFDYIRDYFERYNSNSGKPYTVGISLGFYCGVPDENSEFQEYMKIADDRMYENKHERKKFREK